MDDLKGKRVLVTGGAQGIGLATIIAFLEYKCSIVFSDNDIETGEETERILCNSGAQIYFLHGDMGDEAFCNKLVGFANEKMGGIDILINNAFSFVAAGLEAERKQWQKSMQVGPMGYALMTQLVAPIMNQSGGGAVVNVSSISAHIAQPNRWTYNAAKGAVDQLTKCSALDLAPMKIRVNSVSPGWIWTQEVDKAANFDREKYDLIWGKYHMLRRCGMPSEVATAIRFLCTADASFITGTDLPVDGGYLGLGGEGIGEQSEFAGSN